MASAGKRNEDSLPKVIICGITEQNIPKLIVCDDGNQRRRSCGANLCKDDDEDDLCGRQTSCPQSSCCPPPPCCPPPSCCPPPPCCPPPSCSPPPSSGFPQCVTLEQKNATLRYMQNQMICDLQNKQMAIENLQKNLYSVGCEMDYLSKQNAKLCEKLQEVCESQQCAKSVSQQNVKCGRKASCGKNLTCIKSKVECFSEDTAQLEQQVCDMEKVVTALKKELNEVQAERERLNKSKNVYMVLPPVYPRMPPPNCDGWEKKPKCPMKPRQCNYKPQPNIQLACDANIEKPAGDLASACMKFFERFDNMGME